MKRQAARKKRPAPAHARGIDQLEAIMERLRAPDGCPWDREQDHRTLRWHAVEEVYELLDAIEAADDHEIIEELGDLLLQVIFHCQLGKERRAFNLDLVARRISEKLIRRHPHVFGDLDVKDVDQVWANWEKIKRAEKEGTRHARPSALDGIPRHLPALLRAEKLIKKARRAKLPGTQSPAYKKNREQVGRELLDLVSYAQARGWSAEGLLRDATRRFERRLRRAERAA